jgi:hypothetical protein
LFRIDEQNRPWIFDTYDSSIKTLSADHKIDFCMRYHVETLQEIAEKVSLLTKVVNALVEFFKKKVPAPTPLPITKETMETNREKFLKVCQEALDTDVTPKDEVPDEVACAQTISTLIKKVFPDFPILPLTNDLFSKLKSDKRFKAVLEPGKGRIIISPRIGDTPGHVGAWITEERIASNNSRNGLFQGGYTWQSWVKEFRDRRGEKIYIFDFNE